MNASHDARSSLIAPSTGVALAPFMDGGIAYDRVRERVHVLGALGYAVASVTTPTAVRSIVEEIADIMPGEDRDHIERAVMTARAHLREIQLIDRQVARDPDPPWRGSLIEHPDWHHGHLHQMADIGLTFRSTDPGLLVAIDSVFQPVPPTALLTDGHNGVLQREYIDVALTESGSVEVHGHDYWHFPDRESMLLQLLNVTNEFPANSTNAATLHAGAVRTPTGDILVLIGPEDAGKSTLVAALVAAGCDYASDEAAGLTPDLVVTSYLKPLALSTSSRDALGLAPEQDGPTPVTELRADVALLSGRLGKPTAIICPRFEVDATAALEVLPAGEAVRYLLRNTLNLARSGAVGLASVAGAAEEIPVLSFVHGDALRAAPELLGALPSLV